MTHSSAGRLCRTTQPRLRGVVRLSVEQ
eukprot:COSAG01_NODE_22232_length_865_cov_3.103133_1_plen_27_part_10